MARAKSKVIDLSSALLQQGNTATGTQPSGPVVSEIPVSEMPLVLTLDEVNPFPDNPRTSRNPKYKEIKESIRARGLDTVPKVTRDPERPELGYFFSDGGNTRYAILSELWQETGEERFHRFSCVFKPWPGRLSCVIGHLAENEVRGDLSFIEKALGIKQARSIYEEDLGKSVTLRELSALLATEGYPIHFSGISRMEDTVKYLYPFMPSLLESGLGSPQIRHLLALRGDAEKTWKLFSSEVAVDTSFDKVFGSVCGQFDDPDAYSLDMFRDELIGALVKALPHPSLNYDRWLLELDPKEQNRRKHLGNPSLIPTPSAFQQEETGELLPQVPEYQHSGDAPLSALASTLNEPDNASAEYQEETVPTLNAPRVETQHDLYGAPPVLSGETETLPATETSYLTEETTPDFHVRAGSSPDTTTALQPDITAPSDVAFAEVGLEPVAAIWAIPALQDDIEHLQVMTFRLAFELAEVVGCEAEIKADKADLRAVGYALAVERPSRFAVLLLALTGNSIVGTNACSLSEALTGSDNPADLPLLDDIHTVKLMRLIRVIRRLRELQRGLSVTEKENNHE
ncbi:ParB family protein [Erwinia oleae]|uniref:ParB family protein n=1 Tax=Erwinia oleae TaxID=796334 RepID=UPI0005573322|nr:ParB family protein [Erwinia oleae]